MRNVRIDTSLISQFSQAQTHSDDGAGGGGQPAGAVVLLGIDHDCTPASLSQEVGAAASMGSSRFRRCLQSACSWFWGACRSAEARTSTAWGPSEPGTKPTGLNALRELLHRLDAADFEPLGDRNGVGVSLDKGDEVTDKFR